MCKKYSNESGIFRIKFISFFIKEVILTTCLPHADDNNNGLKLIYEFYFRCYGCVMASEQSGTVICKVCWYFYGSNCKFTWIWVKWVFRLGNY